MCVHCSCSSNGFSVYFMYAKLDIYCIEKPKSVSPPKSNKTERSTSHRVIAGEYSTDALHSFSCNVKSLDNIISRSRQINRHTSRARKIIIFQFVKFVLFLRSGISWVCGVCRAPHQKVVLFWHLQLTGHCNAKHSARSTYITHSPQSIPFRLQ